jgi:hypothetical protein
MLCHRCGWSRQNDQASQVNNPRGCCACGCGDLWRQKDFPQRIGLSLVVVAAVLSTMAWANHQPELSIGILMAFALGDLLLYTFMKDMLVCYRCGARHRKTEIDAAHPGFNLETNERYRQQAIQVAESSNEPPGNS